MRRVGIAVVKSVLYRGVQQEFTNVYFAQLLTAITIPQSTLLDEVINQERQMHGSDVQFKRASAWRADGDRTTNVMLEERALTGTGGQVNNTKQDRERAVLIRWPAGVDSRGLPVYLRKWYHSCGSFNGVPFSDAVLQQSAAIATGDRTNIASYADALRELGGATDFWTLCSKGGRQAAAAAQCHAYLEHHQLGDQWR